MSKNAPDVRENLTDHPAICLLNLDGGINGNAANVIGAQERNQQVFIGTADEATGETFDAMGAIGLSLDPALDEQEMYAELEDRIRAKGYPGVIFHDATTSLDIDQAVSRLEQTDDFAVHTSTIGEPSTDDHVLVGIPAYNEEVGIGSVVHSAAEYADEVIVVDDGSTDKTVQIAERAGATVIEHEENYGKGRAIRTLFEAANNREYDALVLLDGDGQHVPDDIPHVTAPVLEKTCDISIGSRYLEGTNTETPVYRRLGQIVLDVLTTGSARTKVSDSQSGFRALSPAAVDQLRLRTDGMGVESEMISDATEWNLTIEEVPIDVRYEGIDGQTYNPLHHGLSVMTFILQLVRDRHPLLFFGVPGLVLTTFGTLYGLEGILVYQQTGNFYPAKVLVAGFSSIIGVLGIFCGLILNQISNMISEAQEVMS